MPHLRSNLRPATIADLTPLKALVESAYRGDAARAGWTNEADLLQGERVSREALAATLADPAQHVIVAQEEDRLLATITVTEHEDAPAYLGMLAVDPARQAAGLGRLMLAEAERRAAAFGASALEMTVISARPELIAYYERRGYGRKGEVRPFPDPVGAHLDMVVLVKALV